MTRLDKYLLITKGDQMNEIIKAEPSNDMNALISNLSEDQTQQLLGILQTKSIQKLHNSVELMRNDISDVANNLRQFEVNTSKKIENMQTDLHAAIEKNAYVQNIQFNEDYVIMSTLGRTYTPEMLHLFARLMAWAGLVYYSYDLKCHVPYERFIGSVAIRVVGKNKKTGYDFIQYKWHTVKTKKFIDKKLAEAGLFEAFHNHKTKSERDAFLNSLAL